MIEERFRDASRGVEERVDDLIGRMTLEEKVAQVAGIWATSLMRERRFSTEEARSRIGHGIGHVTRIAATSGYHPRESAGFANDVQRFLVDQTRLGIPAIVHEESCAGLMARDATCFPVPIAQAATFQPELTEAMAKVIRRQMRATGAHLGLAPVLDIARDPRWGRVEETYGEDPYLVARHGVAYVRGLQGSDLASGVVATAKHFLGYGASEGGLNWAPARILGRELREVYAFPFQAAIAEARVGAVMNAYNELDGVPAGASRELLVDMLRHELGFDGVLVSDYFTLPTLVSYHNITDDKTEAAAIGLNAGIDIELPAHDVYGDPLREGLASGAIDVALLDVAVRRLLAQKFALGLFEDPFVEPDRAPVVFDTPADRALAKELALKSLVLLKNDGGLLPLNSDVGTVAVIGPAADSIRLFQGDYHYPSHAEAMFEHHDPTVPAPTPMLADRRDDLAEQFPPMLSLVAALRELAPGLKVRHAVGCDVMSTDTSGFPAAVDAARGADVAILVLGDRSGLSNDATTGEARDRADVSLPGVQRELLAAIAATGTPVVLVLVGAKPLALGDVIDHAGAVLMAWLPGEEGGPAIAETLFGLSSPSGRLPISLPRSAAQIPVYYNHKPSGGRSHWKGSYVDMPTTPLFSFGHGLSYTEFEYSALRIESLRDSVVVGFDIANRGGKNGDEVVQLYFHDLIASVTRPVKQLVGFARVQLEPGSSQRVEFEVPLDLIAFHDGAMKRVLEPGTVAVMVGASSTDIRLQGSFEIIGDKRTCELKEFASHVRIY
ncbi:MAG: glycoside hydrolase family 3 C-terminal domain-containing protein [Trueperaceae bacterium]|nr:glycoside hydrolase family 3 C-terminal domain-containing protein [Trueperaceae bacterium]